MILEASKEENAVEVIDHHNNDFIRRKNMEQKENDKLIKRLIEKEKNGEPLSFREASILSSYKQSQKPKLDFSKVKVIKRVKDEHDEERW